MLIRIDTTAISLVDGVRVRALGHRVHQGQLLQISAGICAFTCAVASMSAPTVNQTVVFGIMAVMHCAALLRLLPWMDEIFEMQAPFRTGRREYGTDLRRSMRALYLCITAASLMVIAAILLLVPPIWLAVYMIAFGSVMLAHAFSIYLLANATDR